MSGGRGPGGQCRTQSGRLQSAAAVAAAPPSASRHFPGAPPLHPAAPPTFGASPPETVSSRSTAPRKPAGGGDAVGRARALALGVADSVWGDATTQQAVGTDDSRASSTGSSASLGALPAASRAAGIGALADACAHAAARARAARAMAAFQVFMLGVRLQGGSWGGGEGRRGPGGCRARSDPPCRRRGHLGGRQARRSGLRRPPNSSKWGILILERPPPETEPASYAPAARCTSPTPGTQCARARRRRSGRR